MDSLINSARFLRVSHICSPVSGETGGFSFAEFRIQFRRVSSVSRCRSRKRVLGVCMKYTPRNAGLIVDNKLEGKMSTWKDRFWYDLGHMTVELPNGKLVRLRGPPPFGDALDDDHVLYRVSALADLWWEVMLDTLPEHPDRRDYRGRGRLTAYRAAMKRYNAQERLCLRIGYRLLRIRREMADWVRYRYEHPTWISKPRYSSKTQRQASLIALAVYGALVADELDRMEQVAGDRQYIQASIEPVAFDDLPRLYEMAA